MSANEELEPLRSAERPLNEGHRALFTSQTVEAYKTPDPAIRVMIVDDQPVFREVARALLESDGQFDVVAEADGGTEAVALVPQIQPDVVIMDIQMGDISGIEATRRILGKSPDASVVLTSMTAEREYPRLVREIGALGFIAKRNLNGAALRSVLGIGPGTLPAMAA